MSTLLDTYVSLMQTYSGRDRFIRTIGYTANLLSGNVKGKLSKDLAVLGRSISSTRMVLRLFDDLNMWKVTREFAAHETDKFSRVCTVLSNLSSQVFFPCEHLAWASDQKILSWNASNFFTASTTCWAISLFFNIIKGVRQLILLRRQHLELIKRKKLELPDNRDGTADSFQNDMSQLASKVLNEYILLVKNIGDFLMAVNWLPWKGFLWAGRFSPVRNAFFGWVSSVAGLILVIMQQQKAKSQ